MTARRYLLPPGLPMVRSARLTLATARLRLDLGRVHDAGPLLDAATKELAAAEAEILTRDREAADD